MWLGFVLPLAAFGQAVAQEAAKPVTAFGRAVAQEAAKRVIKWSEAKPIIREYVEKMAADSKASSGVELTDQQKTELVDSIVRNMEAQHIYAFVDP
jgi:hypothetical protein